VLRIKNRLDPDYDSARSAGYRDVGVNLRVVTPETRALGVDAHVCELQLLLRRFAELKVRSCLSESWTHMWKGAIRLRLETLKWGHLNLYHGGIVGDADV
jgi:hypothetical protein